MAVSFFINISEDDFKNFLKQALSEILSEAHKGNPFIQPVQADIMNIKEAAEFLRLKVSSIYEKTHLKLIPHIKKGNKLYFSKHDLEAWLASGKIKTNSELQGDAANYLLKQEYKKTK
jgi:excisionase family DNA binding protein